MGVELGEVDGGAQLGGVRLLDVLEAGEGGPVRVGCIEVVHRQDWRGEGGRQRREEERREEERRKEREKEGEQER